MDYGKELLRFAGMLEKASPIYSSIVAKQRDRLGETWTKAFVDDLYLLFGGPETGAWEKAAWGYVDFCLDASKSQHYFEKNGRYKASKFSEVQKSNYNNEQFMFENYLPGMVISHYLWPHHYLMGETYRTKLMPLVQSRIAPKTFVEGGTGSAVYTLHTLRSLPGVHGYAYDISPHAVAFGKQLLQRAGLQSRCDLLERDVLTDPPTNSADFVLSQEVLEHLEDPATFVKNLYRIARPGGMGFITGAVTAAHSDHIYLFNTPDDVFKLLTDAGFKIVETVIEQADHAKANQLTPKIAGALVEKPSNAAR